MEGGPPTQPQPGTARGGMGWQGGGAPPPQQPAVKNIAGEVSGVQ